MSKKANYQRKFDAPCPDELLAEGLPAIRVHEESVVEVLAGDMPDSKSTPKPAAASVVANADDATFSLLEKDDDIND